MDLLTAAVQDQTFASKSPGATDSLALGVANLSLFCLPKRSGAESWLAHWFLTSKLREKE